MLSKMVVIKLTLVIRAHFIQFPSLFPFLCLNIPPLVGLKSVLRLDSIAGARLL